MEDNTATGTASGSSSEHAGHASGCVLCGIAIPMLERCFNESTRSHFRNSRIEFLKGIRSLLDERIAALSREPENRGTHVTVE